MNGHDGAAPATVRGPTAEGRDGGDTAVWVEVTNTVSVDYTTGIQRVVREVVSGLARPGTGVEVLPVVEPAPGAGFRRLTADETRRLAEHPAGGRAGRRADDLGPLSPLARRVGDLPVTLRARAALAGARARRRSRRPLDPDLALGTPPSGAVFLDVEGSWYDPTPRAELLPRIAAAGATPVVFVHDVMPLLHPEWFAAPHVEVFGDWVRAHLAHSRAFLANSRRTAEDLCAVAGRLGAPVPDEVHVVPLGADLGGVEPVRPEGVPGGGRFLLVVGTLEPRKNQAVVLDAYDRLAARHPDLAVVLVGKEGWMVDGLVRRLRAHPDRGSRVVWLGGVDDAGLAWLYRHAFLAVAPSLYEGYGVPVVEALAHGTPTVASTGGAQPEAAAGAAELFDPSDTDALVDLVAAHLSDPEVHDAAVARAAAFRPPSWRSTTDAIAAELRDAAGA